MMILKASLPWNPSPLFAFCSLWAWRDCFWRTAPNSFSWSQLWRKFSKLCRCLWWVSRLGGQGNETPSLESFTMSPIEWKLNLGSLILMATSSKSTVHANRVAPVSWLVKAPGCCAPTASHVGGKNCWLTQNAHKSLSHKRPQNWQKKVADLWPCREVSIGFQCFPSNECQWPNIEYQIAIFYE